jgi:predicted O-methyltransferase YrrM
MYSTFQIAIKYIRYYLSAGNGKGHGIHSPFVYDLIKNVLNDNRNFYAYNKVEHCRTLLSFISQKIVVEDFGAGSVGGTHKERTIASIVKNAAKPKKLGQLLFRLVNYYQPASIVELGTSLGLSTAYLAMGNLKAKVYTCEGAPSIAAQARKNFEQLELKNIELLEGNFDEKLPVLLSRIEKVDFAFIDGNHRKGPTLQYFEALIQKAHNDTILIFDDIHWSTDMEAAWADIKRDPRVTLTIDLFFLGIVFFRKEFKVKQDVVLRF